MKASEIYSYLNRLYNFNNQAEWDNSVFNNNNPYDEIENIMVCLDINKRVIELAIKNNVKLIISHHPLYIGEPSVENYHTRKIEGYLKKNKISTIFLHTPFDRSIYGMNTNLAFKLNLKNIKQSDDSQDYILGELPQPISLAKLAHVVKNKWDLDFVKYATGYKNKIISRVAICGGAGASLLYTIKGADVFITGDIKHHAWIDSIDLNIPLIEVNHNVENIFVDIVASKLLKLNQEFNILKIKAKINYKII